ncbi:MAG: HAMP domain-containing sensor histidine kinase [Bacteroidota bacterium]
MFARRFYFKLSALFLLLIVALTCGVGYVAFNAAYQFADEADQRLNQDLANVMASEFQPLLREGINEDQIEERIQYLVGINPRIDIYLLGGDGMIKAQFVESGGEPVRAVLNTQPLDAMLAGAPLPMLGPDPQRAEGRKPFTVAPLEIMGETGCYLYIVLGSERYQSVAAMVSGSYIAGTLWKAFALILLVTALVGLLLFALLTRRLSAMSHAVQRFSSGQHDARVDVRSADEIGQLGTTFNRMADTIVQNMDALKRTDQIRRDLIANVSHDLRSPIASIQGYLETILIKAEALSKEHLVGYVDTALSSTRKLNTLVGELFELSKLDAKQVEPEKESFGLLDLVQDIVQQFEPKAASAGVTLAADLPDQAPLVFADIRLVDRAISNLIDNAIRHTPSGGEVRIAPFIDGEGVRVQVIDTGVGIAAEDLPHIFDRFYRVDKSRNTRTGGAGLGLAITKKIVELHNSTLSVTSALGEGTTFSFMLPRVAVA